LSSLLGAAALVVSLVVSACGPNPGTRRDASLVPAPTTGAGQLPTQGGPTATSPPFSSFTGDPFFDPGNAVPGQPGDVIRAREVHADFDGTRWWQVLHWSRTAEDKPVAVSATIIAPSDGSKADRPVFAYAHSTFGMGDQCAPTRHFAGGPPQETDVLPKVLKTGMTIVAPDYQGLGTPGDHAYLVGQAAGRNVLDAIRAASHLAETGVTPRSPVVVWGHSQGGAAAAFTAELQPTYAPEIHLLGAIAGAPSADLSPVMGLLVDPPDAYRGFIPMIFAGLRAGYPELASDDALLSDEGRKVLSEVNSSCLGDAFKLFASTDFAAAFKGLPLSGPRWQAAMAANRTGGRSTPVPILLYVGGDDDVTQTRDLLARYCTLGVTASRKVYSGRNHTTALTDALPDILSFTKARLRGDPAPNSCA
jgi:alpha-beta hydrolase superfamily lysophospholipase